MCTQSDHIILSKTKTNQISWCKLCCNYSLIYGNCCLSLNKIEFEEIKDVLLGLSDEDFKSYTSQSKQVILKNQKASVGLVLTKQNIEEMLSLLDEALTIKQAFGVVYDM